MTLRDILTAAIMAAITLCFSLSLAALTFSGPLAAGAFHAFILRVLSDRLGFANREIEALQR
jgi:amino acid permease